MNAADQTLAYLLQMQRSRSQTPRARHPRPHTPRFSRSAVKAERACGEKGLFLIPRVCHARRSGSPAGRSTLAWAAAGQGGLRLGGEHPTAPGVKLTNCGSHIYEGRRGLLPGHWEHKGAGNTPLTLPLSGPVTVKQGRRSPTAPEPLTRKPVPSGTTRPIRGPRVPPRDLTSWPTRAALGRRGLTHPQPGHVHDSRISNSLSNGKEFAKE